MVVGESDARTHRTPKHFVRNHANAPARFAIALGVRARPRAAFRGDRRNKRFEGNLLRVAETLLSKPHLNPLP